MNPFILFLIIQVNTSIQVSTTEFSSEQACMGALEQINYAFKSDMMQGSFEAQKEQVILRKSLKKAMCLEK